MERQFHELNLYDYFKIILNRKTAIISLVLIVTALSFIYSYLSPKVYEIRPFISIPLLTAADQTKTPLITTAEASVLVANIDKQEVFGNISDQIVDLSAQKIDDVTVNSFQLIVQVNDDPNLAVKVANKTLGFFKNNRSINNKIDEEQKNLMEKLVKARKTLKEAVRIKNMTLALLESKNSLGFNPVDLQIRINQLEDKTTSLELQVKAQQEFDFINKPDVSSTPIEPKILQNTVQGFFASLLAGIILALGMEWLSGIKERNRR